MARDGNRSDYAAPHGVFPCVAEEGDEAWIAIAVLSDAEWMRLVDVMDAPEWARDTRYAHADGRLEDVDAIVPLVQDYGSNQRYWRVAGICVMVGLVVLVGVTLAVRSAKTKPQIEPVKTVDTVTPFGLLSRLRSVQETSQIASDRRSQLVEDIAAIEGHFFAASDAPSAPDLKSIAERWT